MNSISVQPTISPNTFLFVNSYDHDTFIPPDADEFVYGTNTSPGQLAEKDHAFNVVVLQQADIGSHFSNGPNVDHHYIFHLWEFMLVESTA